MRQNKTKKKRKNKAVLSKFLSTILPYPSDLSVPRLRSRCDASRPRPYRRIRPSSVAAVVRPRFVRLHPFVGPLSTGEQFRVVTVVAGLGGP